MEKRILHTGFTMAEVLITLGVIGVIASITLPTVINNIKKQQLKASFHKASNIVENALLQTLSEYDLAHMVYPAGSNTMTTPVPAEEQRKINSTFPTKFKYVRVARFRTNPIDQFSVNFVSKYNYYPTAILSGSNEDGEQCVYILPNGMFIGSINFHWQTVKSGLMIFMDTNGGKGPNKWGYDRFYFNSCGQNGDGRLKVCDFSVNEDFKKAGCYNYAKNDRSPSDSTKGYWDSLKY